MNQLDNRASTFYIALYWAEFMAIEDESFQKLALELKDNRSQVVAELKLCQGISCNYIIITIINLYMIYITNTI